MPNLDQKCDLQWYIDYFTNGTVKEREYLLNILCNQQYEDLDVIFCWDNTPHGYDFWYSVFKQDSPEIVEQGLQILSVVYSYLNNRF